MSGSGDDENTYSSDEDLQINAYDEEVDDDSPVSPEMSRASKLRQDEEGKQIRSQNWKNRQMRGNIIRTNHRSRNGREILRCSGPSSAANVFSVSPRRGYGRTAYVSLVKQTEDEMELVRRRQSAGQIPGVNTTQLHGAEKRDKFKAKRRSANAVTLLFGRGRNVPHAAHVVRSTETFQRGEKSGNETSDTEMHFPLQHIASGESDKTISLRKAKSLENAAKRKTKVLKSEVGLKKLDVNDAKLTEFATTLEARQAKIEERQAKLCRRRAILKQAEEELDSIEAKMDEKEEDHKSRERRIKNRERRLRQEEAGLRLKEASLRKREVAVSQGIDKIEQWRKIVDEKEEMQKRMEEIVEKKVELHGRDIGQAGIFGNLAEKLRLKKSSRDKSGEGQRSPSNHGQRLRQTQQPAEKYPTPKPRTVSSGLEHKKNTRQPNEEVAEKGVRQKSSTLPRKNEIKGGTISLWL